MRILIGLTLLWTLTAKAASPFIWGSDNMAENLATKGLYFNDLKQLITVTVAPTGGLTAPIGSLALMSDAGAGRLFIKLGAADTAWVDILSTSSGWGLLGNLGTVAGTNFIGTNDAVDFVIKTNAVERFRISSAGAYDTTLGTGLVHSNASGILSSSLLVNADVDAAAAIAVSKLAAGTNTHILTTVSGVPTWAASVSDVVGPASSTDNAVVRFDTTTGKLIQNSAAILSDTGSLSIGDGTVALPSLSFVSDTDTGIYSNGANRFSFGTGGVIRGSFNASGNFSIGTSDPADASFYNTKNVTGGTTAYSNFSFATIQSDVTGSAFGYRARFATAAASFTLGNLHIFSAGQSTIGAGSTVTEQNGFNVESTLTGATRNYGFRGRLAAATDAWNLHMVGTAQNYLEGNLSVGVATANSSAKLQVDSTTKGFLPPRMTTAERDAIGTPASGLVIYNTTTNQLNVYRASAWGTVGGGTLVSSFTGTTITATNDVTQVWRYTGGSAQTLTAITPTALSDGSTIDIMGTSDTNTISLAHTDALNGFILNGNWVGMLYSRLTLRWDATSTRYVEVSRNGL